MNFRHIVDDIVRECTDINNICSGIANIRANINSANHEIFYFKLSKLMENVDYKFGIFLNSLWSFSKNSEVLHDTSWNDNLIGLLIDFLENDESEDVLIPTIGILQNLCSRKETRSRIGERISKVIFTKYFYNDSVLQTVSSLLLNLSLEEDLVVDWIRTLEFYSLMDRIMELEDSKHQSSKIVCRCFDVIKKRKLFVSDGIVPMKFSDYVRHPNFHGTIRYEVETLFNSQLS